MPAPKENDTAITSWWRRFHDPVLNRLIIEGYGNNLDIKSAGLRIAQARAALGINEGLAFPQVQTFSGSASSSHSKARDVATVGLGFDVGWELDIWGKYARGI